MALRRLAPLWRPRGARGFSQETSSEGVPMSVAMLVPVSLTAFLLLKDQIFEEKISKVSEDERLERELQSTSFTEWKKSGFEPEAKR